MSFDPNDKRLDGIKCTTIEAHMAKDPAKKLDKPMPYNTNWELEKANEMFRIIENDFWRHGLSENDEYLHNQIAERFNLPIKSETEKQ